MVRNSLIIIFIFAYSMLFAQNDLDKCLNLLQRSEKFILKQDSLIKMLKDDIRLGDMENAVMRKKYENSEITMRYLNIELKKEIKHKKIWQIIGITGLTAFLTTTVLYITKP